TQSVKPLFIKQSAYLRVPTDVAELIDIMRAPTGAVTLRIDEQGCALVYTFAKQSRAITEEPEPIEVLVAAQYPNSTNRRPPPRKHNDFFLYNDILLRNV